MLPLTASKLLWLTEWKWLSPSKNFVTGKNFYLEIFVLKHVSKHFESIPTNKQLYISWFLLKNAFFYYFWLKKFEKKLKRFFLSDHLRFLNKIFAKYKFTMNFRKYELGLGPKNFGFGLEKLFLDSDSQRLDSDSKKIDRGHVPDYKFAAKEFSRNI